MSHPPGGPPPYYGYPKPPEHHPVPGYAYMPTPVMMPMPMPAYPPAHPQPSVDPAFSQPTYVTNYYYQQQGPEPVHVVDNPPPPPMHHDPIDWVPATGSTALSYSHRVVVGGKEGWDASPLWVIRAHHGGDLVPGKLAVKHRQAYIPYNMKEVPVHNFELLCAAPHAIRWVAASHGQVPPGAIPAGNTASGEPLYIGRTKYMRTITPGKVHPSHGCLYIPLGGNEVSHKNYEVLCKVI